MCLCHGFSPLVLVSPQDPGGLFLVELQLNLVQNQSVMVHRRHSRHVGLLRF